MGKLRSNANMIELRRCAALLFFVLAVSARTASAQALFLPQPIGMDGDPSARLVLNGNAAFLRGDLTSASADYRSALRRKPDFAVATFNLGLVEMHESQMTRGRADMDRGILLAIKHRMSAPFVARLRALRNAFTHDLTT